MEKEQKTRQNAEIKTNGARRSGNAGKDRKGRTLSAGAFCACLALIFAACGLVDGLHDYKQGETETVPEAEQQVIRQPLSIGEETTEKEDDAAGSPAQTGAEQVEIELYFLNSDGTALEKETRLIPKEEGIAKAALNQLIAGPKNAGLAPTLAPDTVVNGVNIADGMCTVDLSAGALSLSEDTDDILLAVYSVVDTMCQFAAVDKVRVLTDGKALPELEGRSDAAEAMAPVY